MKKVNNYWVDERNNKWNCEYYTEERAKEQSKSLADCNGCIDCSDCSYCSHCSYCSYCSHCRDCSRCRRCKDCNHCDYCSDCDDCNNFEDNPQRYVTPRIGSRNSKTTIYWLGDNVQVVCGCFIGNLEQWEEAIKKTHKDNEKHREDYLKQVRLVRNLMMGSEEG